MSDPQSTPPATALAPLDVLRAFRAHDGTLEDFFASRTARDPARVYLHAEGRAWTWQAVAEAACALASHLHARGVVEGDRVALAAPNGAWHVLLLLACARLGAIFVPVNPQLREPEAAYLLGHCEPRVVFASGDSATVMAAALRQHGREAALTAPDAVLLDWTGEPATPVAPDPERGCVIIYTSGTTGFPKGALHSERSLIAAGEAFVERMHLQHEERMLVVLPLFHINALFYSLGGSIAAGATLIVEPRFSASTFWNRVVESGATQVNIIEAVATILLERARETPVGAHPLTKVYGARAAMVAPLRAAFGIPMLIGGYAMTEIPGVLSTPVDGRLKPGTMGVLCRHPDPARPWAECRVVDDDGRDLPDDVVGELWVKTPVLMQGYFSDPEATRAATRDGWFMTGDLVRRDPEGFFYFVSRKKDIIRVRGENVAGLEVDRVALSHPAVLMAAAIGVPSSMGDEDILLVVQPKSGQAPAPDDLAAWCAERLASIKVPRYVALVDAMPLTPTHKVAKAALKSDAALRARAVEVRPPRRAA